MAGPVGIATGWCPFLGHRRGPDSRRVTQPKSEGLE